MITYTVKVVARSEIRAFIEKYHYSHSINGVKSIICFGLYDHDDLIGAALFGEPATRGVKERYMRLGYCNVVELRRFVLIDDTRKNAESFFIGRVLRYLRRHTLIDLVVSYADQEYGHEGTIYKASNFVHVGKTLPGRVFDWNGKQYHDRSLRVKYRGEYKPFVKELRAANDQGLLQWRTTKEKHIYVYSVRDKRYRNNAIPITNIRQG